jgi:predicted signal transduction protein with EAL and GGDEF domain
MDASIPDRAGEASGDNVAAFGQEALDAALAVGAGRAALLLLNGVSVAEAHAATGVLRSVDIVETLAESLGEGRVAILAPHLRETGGAADLAARLLGALPAATRASAAIGIAVAPEDGGHWQSLLETADRAAHRANQYNEGRFAFADDARDQRWRVGPLLPGAIAEALVRDEFSLRFQPITDLATGMVSGAETLLRWRRKSGEDWSPAIFIPEAERRGLMEPITIWTFDAAARAAAELSAVGPIGINLSAAMLGPGAVEIVSGIVKKAPVAPHAFNIEITETAPFLNEADAIADVEAIAALGCGIAIDDFGAGQASLSYAVKLPATRIKLDASLVYAAEDNPRARAAIRATAALAAEVGADVVAEGVRDQAMADQMLGLGVSKGQGRHFGAPMRFEAFKKHAGLD